MQVNFSHLAARWREDYARVVIFIFLNHGLTSKQRKKPFDNLFHSLHFHLSQLVDVKIKIMRRACMRAAPIE